MNKKKILIAVGIILLIVSFTTVAVVQSQSGGSQAVDVETPTMESVKAEVMLPGTVKTEKQQTIYFSPELGESYELLVEEGDVVEEGSSLLQYDGGQADSEKETLALQIESGYLQINFIEKQEKALDEREKELKKELGEKEAKETIQAEKDQLEFEKKNANLDLRQLLLQQDELEAQDDKLLIKSDIAGTVFSAEMNPVEQQPILEIASTDQLLIEGTLSEYDSLVVEGRQDVAITSDAQPDLEWSGTVHEVGLMPLTNEMTGDMDRTEYPLTVHFNEGELDQLKPGYNLILRIATEERTALTVPASALITEDDQSFVLAVEEGKAVRKDVEVGIQTNQRYEVKTGLTETDEIIVEPSGIQDGNDVTKND
ncbi:efflux RND transporter periplasmic adaptor subunit [Alkalicoccobacillus porphyridii]|uniref:Efflux RND transporter periplasmic adaptor subunit n=1 Tax=Alkalicoccobacillus porphyridii TaxID=2597270 RepID=A0A553ZUU6_9BACI|nr:efflux RND transporter periplasmic adaptor subunit [Alkalicoccobacillus porphyridii]TSB45095.1 efflux RND transporter periplasmic adaptor subunit [Alkalicoccobacillus porphyridii]